MKKYFKLYKRVLINVKILLIDKFELYFNYNFHLNNHFFKYVFWVN